MIERNLFIFHGGAKAVGNATHPVRDPGIGILVRQYPFIEYHRSTQAPTENAVSALILTYPGGEFIVVRMIGHPGHH